jgi:hypothetical protein
MPIQLHAEEYVRLGAVGFDLLFLAEAGLALARAREPREAKHRTEELGASTAAILFAAMSCEAYLSEHLSFRDVFQGPAQPRATNPRGRRGVREKWRTLFGAESPGYDLEASHEYAAMCCLTELRNQIAHRNARFAPVGRWPERLDECIRSGAIPFDPDRSPDDDWTIRILWGGAASWAVSTALNWLEVAERQLPQLVKRSLLSIVRDVREEGADQRESR